MFALGQSHIRPSEVSAKVQTDRPITQHDPGNIVPRSAKPTLTPRRARPKPREPGTSLAAAQPVRVPRPMHPSEPGKNVPRPAEKPSAKSHPSDHAGRPRIRPAPTVPTRPQPDCPADRPARPSQRRGRPEALFEAQTYVFKPGLTLSRL
ncbi:unnamed protein product [Microthlaspi erraticum]|uniref:Uncharacterized protein n=1 Tax=Microthlaspi erraticum TaxID=1685480 RepID=A0A6D2J897_9BRAS|nr:unnamed protein product [Microthlaspi erraticum]